jgi:hypothetical protein
MAKLTASPTSLAPRRDTRKEVQFDGCGDSETVIVTGLSVTALALLTVGLVPLSFVPA